MQIWSSSPNLEVLVSNTKSSMVTSWQASRSTKPIDLNHIRHREIETPSWTWIIESYATELLQYSMWFIYLFSVFKLLNPKSSWWWLKFRNFRKFHVTIHECLQCRYIEMNTIPFFIGIIVDGRLQSQKKSCTSKDCRGLDVPIYCCRCLANGTVLIGFEVPIQCFLLGSWKLEKSQPFDTQKNKEFAYHHHNAPAFWSTFTLLVCKAKPGLSVLMLEEILYLHIWETCFTSSMLNMTNEYELRIQAPI